MTEIVWTETEFDIADLSNYDQNPRRISPAAFERLKVKIQEQGYHNRLIVQPDGAVIGGNQRLRAFRELGYKKIKCLVPSRSLTEDEFRKLVITDNISDGEWDMDILANDYDAEELLDWGFPDGLLKMKEPEYDDEKADLEIQVDLGNLISKIGDIWICGDHRIMCGDSTQVVDLEQLMDGTAADMVFTDPPYGIDYSGGRTQVVEAKTYGKIKGDDLQGNDLSQLIQNVFLYNKPDADVYVCVSPIMQKPFLDFIATSGKKLDAVIVWDKKNAGLGYMAYRRQCEFILFVKGGPFRKGDATDFDLWQIGRDSGKEYIHGTQKPVAVPRRAIENSSKKGDAVLDLFSGSASTMISCEQTNRRCYTMEIDPAFVDAGVRRWMQFTNQQAYNAETGESFPLIPLKIGD